MLDFELIFMFVRNRFFSGVFIEEGSVNNIYMILFYNSVNVFLSILSKNIFNIKFFGMSLVEM